MKPKSILIDTYRQKYEACALLKTLGYSEINANGGVYPCLLVIDEDKNTVHEKHYPRFSVIEATYTLKDLRKEAKARKSKKRRNKCTVYIDEAKHLDAALEAVEHTP